MSENKLGKRLLLLALLVLLAGALVWWSQSNLDGNDEQADTSAEDSADYFAFLRDAREQIRNSDSHLASHYQRLIDAGDIEGLIFFLRENFEIVPGGDNKDWGRAVSERRWGSVAMLRGGTGTPRELAELLEAALNDMGLDARVVEVQATAPIRSFAPAPAVATLSLNLDTFGGIAAPQPVETAANVPDNSALWNRVADVVPDDEKTIQVFDNTLAKLPTVSFTKGESTYVANLWGVADEPYVDTTFDFVGSGGPTPSVTVKLEVAMADRPNNPITVATARWNTEEIAGSQIVAGFAPATDSAESLLLSPPRHFTTFTPVLRLTGSRFQGTETPEPIVGTPFSIGGQVFGDDGGEQLPISGRVRTDGDATQVATLNVKRATTGSYPWVSLDMDVLNASDQSLPGVPLGAFNITIDGAPAAAFMESNTEIEPGVLFLLDVSTSVADEFRGAAANDLVQTVATEVQNEFPDARFRVGLVSGSGASMLSWRTDIKDLESDVKHFGMGSPLWRAAAEVAGTSASLVVFITDGHAADREGPLETPDIESERAIRAGPPFIVVGAVKPDGDVGPAVAAITELSDGKSIPMGDTQKVITEVVESVQEQLSPYKVWVRVDSSGPTHDIVVEQINGVATATTTIEAPPESVRSALRGPVGIYLSVSANGAVSERTLAGHPYRSAAPVSETAARETLFGLFGDYVVFAEAGTPNSAQILDDLITSRLSWQPVVEADDIDTAADALGHVWRLPRSAFTFSLPLKSSASADGHRIIDYGMRWWIHSKRRVLGDGVEYDQESVDLLSNTRFFSTAPDADLAFADTFHASATLTDLESAFYDDSAVNRLGDRELMYAGRKPLPDVSTEQRAAFANLTSGWRFPYQFVVPANGDADAAVAIDVTLGTAVGLLHDTNNANKGAGITEEEANQRFDMVDRMLDAVGDIGGAPAAWAKLEKAKMEKLRFATILIIRMEPPDLLGMIRDEACGAASGAVGAAADAGIRAAAGSWGDAILDAIGEYDDAADRLGMGGLESPVSIPGCE